MRLLLINTSGHEGSVALADTSADRPVLASEVLPGRSSSEHLVPAVRRLMESQLWKLCDLAAIVVVHGPGSFTGVRVGLSAAKGFSEAAGVPLIAVSRLALLASAAGQGGATVHAVLDAGRREFYYGEYAGRHCVREALLTEAEVKRMAGSGTVVVCEAWAAEALTAIHPILVPEPSAADALSIAIERVEAAEFEDVMTLDANYLRRSDMEIFAKPTAKGTAG
jgi:tRNA threonylcarbamoyladenosine biosynthesis protein TsaB